jgi:diadenosine tetraphosphate (Ap4A) HIT family hydrolase
MGPAMQRCDESDLCYELAGESETEFRRLYEGDPSSRVLIESSNLAVIVDLSPLVEGHVLVLPKRHYLNFCEVIADHAAELGALLNRLLPVYEQLYGRYSLLEHGSSTEMRTSACINHAHLHILPVEAGDIRSAMTADGLTELQFPTLGSLAVRAQEDASYFLCGDASGISLFGVGVTMPKQYLRALAARVLGLEDDTWDWAVFIRKNVCRETFNGLYDALEAA